MMSVEAQSHGAGNAGRLLAVIDRVAREVEPSARAHHRLQLATRLDHDLALDSLARAELVLRVEREFGVDMPEAAIAAETPQALLELIATAPLRGERTRRDESAMQQEPVAQRPDEARSLNAVLAWHLDRHPDRVHLQLLDESQELHPLTFREIHDTGARVATGLHARGIRAGDTVALMLPTSLDYFHAFLGVLHAGAVPVPIYPPTRRSQFEEHIRRHGRILDTAGASMMITVPEARSLARLLHAEAPSLRHFVTISQLLQEGESTEAAHLLPDALGLLQFTSGSTGDPKGVMLSHGDLLANVRAMGRRLDVTSEDVIVSWLPLYHDMGLIGAWLGSLYFSARLVVMSPLTFLAHPLRWLETIHRERGTISGGPNFGFEFCLRALESQMPSELDLSCWRVAFNGAEPVSSSTLERFQHALAPFGFPSTSLTPVYGLAEAGVGLCIPRAGRGPIVDCVDAERFSRSGHAAPVASGACRNFVNCGPPLSGYEVRVVDDDGREQPDRQEGHIQFRGPSATRGYFHRPELSRELFDGEWLRTGDRGYLAGGDIHVTGRVKDMLVRGGRNLYPYDLEAAVGDVAGVRKGCVAVFGNPDPRGGAEQLVVVVETRETHAAPRRRIEQAIQDAAIAVTGIPADVIVLVAPHVVPKTSSGKIRRSAARELYRTNRLEIHHTGVKWQLLRLWVESLLNHARVVVRRLVSVAYAAAVWSLAAIAGFLLGLVALLVPSLSVRWKIARWILRITCWLSGVGIAVEGLDRLPTEQPCVLVANHQSYIDALVLAAILPRGFRFLAKAELETRPLAGRLLRRFGVLFVERFEARKASEDAHRIQRMALAGQSLAIFPEGTFTRGAGLGAFHLGAFIAATRAGLPVVPVALRGTRSVLRGDEWFPRAGDVEVVVGDALMARSDSWEEAVTLRDRARDFILRHCGEPDALAE